MLIASQTDDSEEEAVRVSLILRAENGQNHAEEDDHHAEATDRHHFLLVILVDELGRFDHEDDAGND